MRMSAIARKTAGGVASAEPSAPAPSRMKQALLDQRASSSAVRPSSVSSHASSAAPHPLTPTVLSAFEAALEREKAVASESPDSSLAAAAIPAENPPATPARATPASRRNTTSVDATTIFPRASHGAAVG